MGAGTGGWLVCRSQSAAASLAHRKKHQMVSMVSMMSMVSARSTLHGSGVCGTKRHEEHERLRRDWKKNLTKSHVGDIM